MTFYINHMAEKKYTESHQRQQLVEIFKKDPEAKDFPAYARGHAEKYYKEHKSDRKVIDPKQLNQRAVFLSKLRTACINENIHPKEYEPEMDALEKSYPDDPVVKKFRSQTLREQLVTLKEWRQLDSISDAQTAIENVIPLIPTALLGLGLTRREKAELNRIREKQLKKKHPQVNPDGNTPDGQKHTLDGNQIMDRVMLMPDGKPALASDNAYRIMIALLLATGRRSQEMMTSMVLDPVNGDGLAYKAMFTGQKKTGGVLRKPFEIPLLAPFWLVAQGMDKLDELMPNLFGMDSATFAKQNQSTKLNNAIQKLLGEGFTPHTLRGLYTMMCAHLYKCDGMVNSDGKPDVVAYTAKILGHSGESSAKNYDRVIVSNLTRPFIAIKPAETKEEKKEETKPIERKEHVKKDIPTKEETKAATKTATNG